LYAEISMSRRKIVMCMIPAFGAAPLCVLRKNAPLLARSNKSVCAIPFASIMPKAVFLVGGIIGCWRFKKIADSASTRFLPANHWPNVAPPPGSIAKCAKAKILPITRRSGQSFLRRKFTIHLFESHAAFSRHVIPSREDDEGPHERTVDNSTWACLVDGNGRGPSLALGMTKRVRAM